MCIGVLREAAPCRQVSSPVAHCSSSPSYGKQPPCTIRCNTWQVRKANRLPSLCGLGTVATSHPAEPTPGTPANTAPAYTCTQQKTQMQTKVKEQQCSCASQLQQLLDTAVAPNPQHPQLSPAADPSKHTATDQPTRPLGVTAPHASSCCLGHLWFLLADRHSVRCPLVIIAVIFAVRVTTPFDGSLTVLG